MKALLVAGCWFVVMFGKSHVHGEKVTLNQQPATSNFKLGKTPSPNQSFSASILTKVKDRDAADWEELARREPYFAVLTDQGSLGVDSNKIATAAFFETGEADMAALLAAIASLVGGNIPLTSSLDFGCGVGRLTLPLARRATSVVACDIAPTMLAHARRNAESAGLHNVTYIESAELAGLRESTFDFVCSLLVLQYIRPAVGYEIIRALVSLLAPAGIAALQVTCERSGADLRRLAHVFSGKARVERRPVDDDRLSYAQINEYSRNAVQRHIEAVGAQVIGQFPTHHGDTGGAVLIIRKPDPSGSPR